MYVVLENEHNTTLLTEGFCAAASRILNVALTTQGNTAWDSVPKVKSDALVQPRVSFNSLQIINQ